MSAGCGSLGGMARSFYKGESLGSTPACAICVGKGQGTRAQLHLPGGVSVWLCAAHRDPRPHPARRDVAVSLMPCGWRRAATPPSARGRWRCFGRASSSPRPRPSRLVFLAAPSRRGGAAVGGGGGASAGHRRSPPSRAGLSRPRPAAIAGDDAPLVPRGPLARRAAPWAAGRPAAAPAGSPSSRCRPGRGSGCGGGRRGRASERRRRRGRAGPGWARSARGSRPGRPPGPPAAA